MYVCMYVPHKGGGGIDGSFLYVAVLRKALMHVLFHMSSTKNTIYSDFNLISNSCSYLQRRQRLRPLIVTSQASSSASTYTGTS